MQRVYLDHAATTPLDPRVLDAMLPHLKEHYGNASSVHTLGRKARFAVEESREKVAALLGAEPSEIVFTSGGTESNNLALKGIMQAGKGKLVTSAAEHEAILRPAERLQASGHSVQFLKPAWQGSVTPEQLREALHDRAGLVSLMHANNETGALSPVKELAVVAHEHGVLFHADAVQTAGLFSLDVNELGVDLLSCSAHKFNGPKGVGVLFVRSGTEVVPVVEGGAQERRRRGGTENVAGIVGLAAALELAVQEAPERLHHISRLRDLLMRYLTQQFDGQIVLNTPLDAAQAAPHIINIAFPPQDGIPVDGEMLLLNLDLEGVYVSAGSACTSGALEPSHVLLAMGLDRPTASAALRFSIGKNTTEAEIDYAVDKLRLVLNRIQPSHATQM